MDFLKLLVKYYLNYSSDTSLMMAEEALELSLQTGYASGKCLAYKNMGAAYYLSALPDSSMYYSVKSLEVAKKLGDIELQSSLFNNIGGDHYR